MTTDLTIASALFAILGAYLLVGWESAHAPQIVSILFFAPVPLFAIRTALFWSARADRRDAT